MNRDDVYKIMKHLGLTEISDREDWVSSTCPFGPYLHENKVSTRNSFGISVGEKSFYHCFSCNSSGPISILPSKLWFLSGKDDPELRKFCFTQQGNLAFQDVSELMDEKPVPMPLSDYNRRFIPVTKPFRSISSEMIELFRLRYDPEENRVMFPIFDRHGRLLGIKGRAVNPSVHLRYRIYTEIFKGGDPKRHGVWYGMQFKLDPTKALVLTEGEIDTILLKQFGVKNVWGVMGVGITKAQITALSNVTIPIVYFFDDDKAGHDLTMRLVKEMTGLVKQYRITNYYGCKDASKLYEKGLLAQALKSKA